MELQWNYNVISVQLQLPTGTELGNFKRIFGPKKLISLIKIVGQTNFESKQILGPKKSVSKNFDSKKFLIQKFLGPTIYFQNILSKSGCYVRPLFELS